MIGPLPDFVGDEPAVRDSPSLEETLSPHPSSHPSSQLYEYISLSSIHLSCRQITRSAKFAFGGTGVCISDLMGLVFLEAFPC